MSGNLYTPTTLRIAQVRDEAPDVRTLALEFVDPAERERFFAKYRVGMFGLYGLPGAGESPFCIASPPTRTEGIECTFRRTGRVTAALQDREPGQTITFRGPYGNYFPLDDWRGRDLLFVAGGIALPPVRSVIWNVLDRRREFGKVTILYGARTVADLVYKHELADWAARDDVSLVTTVDPGGETADWTGKVGFVRAVLEETAPAGAGTVAVVCGADHDQVHAAGPLETGLRGGRHLHNARKPDEVRRRQVRPLQRRQPLRLQGRPRLHPGATPDPAARRPLTASAFFPPVRFPRRKCLQARSDRR